MPVGSLDSGDPAPTTPENPVDDHWASGITDMIMKSLDVTPSVLEQRARYSDRFSEDEIPALLDHLTSTGWLPDRSNARGGFIYRFTKNRGGTLHLATDVLLLMPLLRGQYRVWVTTDWDRQAMKRALHDLAQATRWIRSGRRLTTSHQTLLDVLGEAFEWKPPMWGESVRLEGLTDRQLDDAVALLRGLRNIRSRGETKPKHRGHTGERSSPSQDFGERVQLANVARMVLHLRKLYRLLHQAERKLLGMPRTVAKTYHAHEQKKARARVSEQLQNEAAHWDRDNSWADGLASKEMEALAVALADTDRTPPRRRFSGSTLSQSQFVEKHLAFVVPLGPWKSIGTIMRKIGPLFMKCNRSGEASLATDVLRKFDAMTRALRYPK